MSVICSKCDQSKEKSEFYKNSRKRNGLESHCKDCILKKKKDRYVIKMNTKKKNRVMRNREGVRVMDLSLCTVETYLITRPRNIEQVGLEGVVGDLICLLEEKKKSKVFHMQE